MSWTSKPMVALLGLGLLAALSCSSESDPAGAGGSAAATSTAGHGGSGGSGGSAGHTTGGGGSGGSDDCPDDPDKTEPGQCGCGTPDDDSDADTVADCLDQCPGFDDTEDADGDTIPDGCDPDSGSCTSDPDCDDGLACTDNTCDVDLCVTAPLFECDWPAEPASSAVNLTAIEGPLQNDFHTDLSGAVWNPVTRTLWVCRNNGPSKIWAIVEDGGGGFEIEYRNGERGEWSDFGDLEGLTLADFDESETLYVIVEGQEQIKEYDLSTYGTEVLVNAWDTSPHLPVSGGSGAEGITFVPDSFLAAQGFVDESNTPRQSALGMGGLMFVGHQNGGGIYVFDLDRAGGTFSFVGEYQSAADETAALEFDRSTGRLYIWHGAGHNTLEVALLSSDPVGNGRKLRTEMVYSGPAPIPFASENHEGIALTSTADCDGGHRDLFMTTDGGGLFSLLWYREFPCP